MVYEFLLLFIFPSQKIQKFTSVYDIGKVDDQNVKYRKTMEDQSLLIDGFLNNPKLGLYAIMDGHGGSEASQMVREKFSLFLTEEIYNEIFRKVDEVEIEDQNITQEMNQSNSGRYISNYEQIDKYIEQLLQPPYNLLKNTCKKIDQYLCEQNLQYVGSTLCCVLITENYIYTINIGDSRCVLSENGTAQRLTRDHKPIDPEEQDRIKKAGGAIVMGRVNGVISVSRALGDHCIKQFIISEPEVNRYSKSLETQEFLIIACDGLWDVVSDQEAVDFIKNSYKVTKNCQRTTQELKKRALAKGTQDNVSFFNIFTSFFKKISIKEQLLQKYEYKSRRDNNSDQYVLMMKEFITFASKQILNSNDAKKLGNEIAKLSNERLGIKQKQNKKGLKNVNIGGSIKINEVKYQMQNGDDEEFDDFL